MGRVACAQLREASARLYRRSRTLLRHVSMVSVAVVRLRGRRPRAAYGGAARAFEGASESDGDGGSSMELRSAGRASIARGSMERASLDRGSMERAPPPTMRMNTNI